MKFLFFLCFLCCVIAQGSTAWSAPMPLEDLSARAAFLIEARTGRVIYEKNAYSRLFPASTTKMATALVTLESGRMHDVVTVGINAAGAEGSSMRLAAGDRLYLRDLVYGMLMVSGNDATIAVAEHLAGSVEAYADRMTQRVRVLGAQATRFVNTSGLPNPEHYSTAADLGRIAAQAYKNPEFREIVKTKRYTARLLSGGHLSLENTNLLLGAYQGCNGIKTGYTEAAGECLVASAERHGVHLIAVVMNAAEERRFDEAAALLDYGFQQVRMQVAYDRHALTEGVHVRHGAQYKITVCPKMNISLPVLNGDSADFSVRTEVPRFVEAPVRVGQHFGYVKILYKGEEVDQVEMIAEQDVPSGFSLLSILMEWLDNFLLYFDLL